MGDYRDDAKRFDSTGHRPVLSVIMFVVGARTDRAFSAGIPAGEG
jgi:hypothetical protein